MKRTTIKLLSLSTLLLALSYTANAQDWKYYDSLRIEFQRTNQLDSALIYAEKSVNYVKENIGNNDTLLSQTISNLSLVHYNLGNYSEAEELLVELVRIRESLYGKESLEYAYALNNLASLYFERGRYREAEEFFKQAKPIYSNQLGNENPDYATICENLAILYMNMGRYAEAEPLYIETKAIRKAIFGTDHDSYAKVCNSLAELYRLTGRYSEAEPLYIEAKDIRERLLGKEHPNYAAVCNNLALLYFFVGRYFESESLFLEAKMIRENFFGKEHPVYALACNNLAGLYGEMGNYFVAIALHEEAKAIREKTLGKNHPSYATSCNNLATLYRTIGRKEEAIALFLEAKEIRSRVLGVDHPNYASVCNNLALYYEQLEMFSEAEPLYLEANQIYENRLGKLNMHYAISCNNLSRLYRKIGRYSEAEAYNNEALEVYEAIFGKEHPDYAVSLIELASLYEKQQKLMESKNAFIESVDIKNKNIFLNFSFLSEKEKELYYLTQDPYFSRFYSFALRQKDSLEGISEYVFNNVIKNKGLLLKSSTAMRNAIHNSNDSILIETYDKWISQKQEISKLYGMEVSRRDADISTLEQQANELEKELVLRSQVFSDFDKMQGISWENIRNNLKQGEAAIEFIHFGKNEKRDTVLYVALVIAPESSSPDMIRLFEESELKKILEIVADNDYKKVQEAYGIDSEPNTLLYELVWKPMEEKLHNVETIYLSPSGLLHKVSFAAIAKEKDVYLCDIFNLQNLTGTVKIAIPDEFIFDENTSASLFGGINYTDDNTEYVVWEYLEGTKEEVVKIQNLLESNQIEATIFSQDLSTEKVLKKVAPTSNILHIATHGFFYSGQKETTLEESEIIKGEIDFRGSSRGFGYWKFVNNPNPLMRAGLTFSGANRVWSDNFFESEYDGVLTAEEVTSIDMSNVGLVVLSACETGLGDIRGSEGVYGLQRAFKMAGVKYLIMSLWQVPDKETVEFMEIFYTKLLDYKDVRKSFYETQREMRQKFDPFFWAAFVLIE
jgi:CHAT domain-containing protein/Flp pilus assembly protein TadD